jgi:hypothetical protein
MRKVHSVTLSRKPTKRGHRASQSKTQVQFHSSAHTRFVPSICWKTEWVKEWVKNQPNSTSENLNSVETWIWRPRSSWGKGKSAQNKSSWASLMTEPYLVLRLDLRTLRGLKEMLDEWTTEGRNKRKGVCEEAKEKNVSGRRVKNELWMDWSRLAQLGLPWNRQDST